ncbi:MAG: hypothetical protein MUQ43_05675, partial [Reinekea forsetii]|nr:hypothetical protein [Reinekea forsetii]MDO7673902.1 hypothetical protein [Reinekea forsetii]
GRSKEGREGTKWLGAAPMLFMTNSVNNTPCNNLVIMAIVIERAHQLWKKDEHTHMDFFPDFKR